MASLIDESRMNLGSRLLASYMISDSNSDDQLHVKLSVDSHRFMILNFSPQRTSPFSPAI